MEIEEIKERTKHSDVRVFHAIQNAKLHDKSFTEKGFLGMTPKYSQSEVREIWFKAMALGIEEGLRLSSLEGQKIGYYGNCKNQRQKEFLDKFYKLSEEYNCGMSYHPTYGMCVIDLDKS